MIRQPHPRRALRVLDHRNGVRARARVVIPASATASEPARARPTTRSLDHQDTPRTRATPKGSPCQASCCRPALNAVGHPVGDAVRQDPIVRLRQKLARGQLRGGVITLRFSRCRMWPQGQPTSVIRTSRSATAAPKSSAAKPPPTLAVDPSRSRFAIAAAIAAAIAGRTRRDQKTSDLRQERRRSGDRTSPLPVSVTPRAHPGAPRPWSGL